MNRYTCLVLLLIVLCSACKQKKQEVLIQVEKKVHVQVAPVQKQGISETVKLTGEITAKYKIDVFSKVNGIVISENIREGNKVNKDEVLAEVIQDIPGMEFSPVKIEATGSGYISRDLVEAGTRVNMQQPMYTISELDQVYMQAKITEGLLSKIRIGDQTQIEVESYPGIDFSGRIAEIAVQMDQLSRTADIKIMVNNPALKLRPGMFAICYLTIGRHTGMLVPLDAIVRSGALKYIFCVREGKAKKLLVDTGLIQDQQVEIIGPVQDQDVVIVLGQDMLDDGQAIVIGED